MKSKLPLLALLTGAVALGTALCVSPSRASDHDDGTTDMKTQNLNLTDLYVFMENSQKAGATEGDMIFVMNCNPRSLPQQDYYFNAGARYEFHVSRVGDATKNEDAVRGVPDVDVRFEFAAPDVNKVQTMTVTAIRNGGTPVVVTRNTDNSTIQTTARSASGSPRANALSLDGTAVTVFAGLREDPFFFDVNQFFKVRSTAAQRAAGQTSVTQETFKTTGSDFTAGLNVLSIVARIPRAFFQEATGTKSTTFDVWETVSVKG